MILKIISNKEVLISEQDETLFMLRKWYISKKGYLTSTTGFGRNRSFHNCLFDPVGLQIVDHINGNKLDNRRCNLRLCSKKENNRNKSVSKKSRSGLRGVYPSGSGWKSEITVDNTKLYLGYFKSKKEALVTYEQAAKEYFGSFAGDRNKPSDGSDKT